MQRSRIDQDRTVFLRPLSLAVRMAAEDEVIVIGTQHLVHHTFSVAVGKRQFDAVDLQLAPIWMQVQLFLVMDYLSQQTKQMD